MNFFIYIKRLLPVIFITSILAGCGGEDFMPIYFPPPDDEGAKTAPSENAAMGDCTISFTSRLCITIKGDNISAGATEEDALCTEVAPFPIHISGSTAVLKGSEFPDINIEGHGLPVPIIINGRGLGDGTNNVGEGTVDGSGNITIDGFSFYILALGIEAEIPGLTLTTGSSSEMPHLEPITGSPPDVSGAMTLVSGTILGHTLDAADEFLMGASMTAVFDGSITPTISECSGNTEKSVEVKKLSIDADGGQTEVPIPEDNLMEISSGTFIADGNNDIGDRFESHAKFIVKNIGSSTIKYGIPPRKGPFYLSSLSTLTGVLSPQETILLDITFRPTNENSEPGKIIESLPVGPDQFMMTAVALEKSGSTSVDAVNDDGDITSQNIGGVNVGDAEVPANGERDFFLCKEIECDGEKAWSECTSCPDPSTNPCELLPISTDRRPLGEVDGNCSPTNPDATPLLNIDMKGSSDISLVAKKQIIAIRNSGVRDMKIESITIEDTPNSKSKGQFIVPEGAIFVAKSFAGIKEQAAKALEGKRTEGIKPPFILPPFQKGFDESTAYIVVVYQPNDLVGADGNQAGVGSVIKDKALLKIVTDTGDIVSDVTGTTTISDSPSLELYFKTMSGTRNVRDDGDFPFKGITAQTVDLAVPLFLRVSDTSQNSMRITSITVAGGDKDNFIWLGTSEDIAAVTPEAGKGMRCSIPTVDESTGDLIDESFDLNPVSLTSPGFDIAPGAYSLETMPLFGCIDFHRGDGTPLEKRLYETNLIIEAQELTAAGTPARNPDGSFRTTELRAKLLAAIDPISGKMVLRITQTMSIILNPQLPGMSSIASYDEVKHKIDAGTMKTTDLQLFTGALILDPFDEMMIKTSDGEKILSTPNDGVTSVFRTVDTHPISKNYDDEALFDYASLLHDSGLETDSGIFADYPNISDDTKANGWRIFTSTLSYPGPVAPMEDRPEELSDCLTVDPCSPEGLKMFTDAGVGPDGKGACAFFYATGGRYDSPAFHTPDEMAGGEYENLCNRINQPQTLYDIDEGHYSVDGKLTFEEAGLRFFGPTYFHNPGGPLGSKPPLDEVFHMSFTTGTLKPSEGPEDYNVLPDTKIDLAKNEFKINLTDTALATPPICEANTDNAIRGGKPASTWKYIKDLLYKDAEGTIPAGCPGDDNDFTGGSAYLRGRDIDPETGVMTLVTGAKFGPSDDLTFAFKDVMMFVVLNGWICDPMGSEENFEGSRCYDTLFNERDRVGQFSITE